MGLLASLAVGITVAQANPIATVTVQNNWTGPATYSTSLSNCNAATVTPAFGDVNAGDTSPAYSVSSSFATTLSCQIQYAGPSSRSCRWVVSRQITLNCNPVTGVCVQTWNYPKVVITKGGSANCTNTFTSVSDTNAVVTPSNGAFSVTLTAN